MSADTRDILERLERGEINSQDAIKMMSGEGPDFEDSMSEGDAPSVEDARGTAEAVNHYLRVDVHRLDDQRPQVHVTVPLRIVELGLSLGSKYAPELNDLDLNRIVEDLHSFGEGTVVEVEDIEDNQHVIVRIEKV